MKRTNLLIILFANLLILSSCSKTVYVPVEAVRTEYKHEQFRDLVYVADSVIIRTKADTVYYEKYHLAYRDKLIRDSIFVTDSVRVTYPVEVVKETNILKDWQIGLMLIGAVSIGFILFLIIKKISIK